MPAALLSRPELPEELQFFFNAFWDLTGDRQIGALGGAGRIPFTAIDRWAARYRVEEPDAFERLKTFVQALDAEFLAVIAKPDP